jgi:Mlc titration factor MtfA (ptsG expression regulator)
VIDRTSYGVVQHEQGHAVDCALGGASGDHYFSDFSVQLRSISREDKITNYCPNDAEWFAEMFRLFVTNSDLLKNLRPRTYAIIKDFFKPVIDQPWQHVLKDAPERTIAQAAKKIESIK